MRLIQYNDACFLWFRFRNLWKNLSEDLVVEARLDELVVGSVAKGELADVVVGLVRQLVEAAERGEILAELLPEKEDLEKR